MHVEMNRMSDQDIDDAHMLNHLISSSPNAFSTDFQVAWHEAFKRFCADREMIVLKQGASR